MNANEHTVPSGQHYSGRNRVPNIQEFMQSLDAEKKERDAAIDEQLRRNRHHKEVRDHFNDFAAFLKNETRSVRDPVTGKDVGIRDTDLDYEEAAERPQLSIPNQNLGKPSTISTSSKQAGEEYRLAQDLTAPPDPIQKGSTSDVPIRSEKTSVLFFKTPSVSYEPMFSAMEKRANVLCLAIFVGIVVVGKMFGGRLVGLVPLAICVASAVMLWAKDLIRRGRDLEWSSEQERGETATVNLIPESVEWINTALGISWGLMNPEMFSAVADTIEDVMAASLPGMIEHVRVADIQHGNNPLRILNMRALPDSHVSDIRDEIRKENAQKMDPDELAAVEQAGSFYNLEVSVAYHAKPSSADISSKARNMGMQLIFYLGIKGLFGVPLPIWVELIGLVATARVRVQLTPDPPFVKTLTVTLMGRPKVQAGCTPMVEKGVNILNLPLISNFVNWAIGATASMYVAPKSLTLDVSKMLQGDDIQKETFALGVIYIKIHKATGLSKQDNRGSRGGGSDPYITICWSKFGKPQFCTRVIQDDLNPVFEESCGLLLTSDLVTADEQLSVELWDSDRSSADDVVGKIELSIQKLIQHPGQMFSHVSKLRGVKADSSMPGELHWEVGFFGKTQLRKALRTDGRNVNLPKELAAKREFQDDYGSVQNEVEDAVIHTPPDPLWPSGILSIVVHQIVGLEFANMNGSNGDRRGKDYESARPEAGAVEEEQGKNLPSSYCTILVNDELVYKTRTKVVSSQPIFNAGTERFVRDWRSCIVTVAIRDSRHRQHDPLIGVVPLRLSDLMQTKSEVTRWYPLDGGIGFGRIRISLLFRSVELRLPPQQLGWDIGTFEFLPGEVTITNYSCPANKASLRLRTGGSSLNVKKEDSELIEGGIKFNVGLLDNKPALRLPVRHRYRSPVLFEVYPAGRRKPDGYAALWLLELMDGVDHEFDIPLFRVDNSMRLSQNYITQENYQSIPDLDIAEVGRVRFRGRFSAGTDMTHVSYVADNNMRETIETWEACYAEGVRQQEVRPEIPPIIQKLHTESLTRDRDVLARADDKEKERWLAQAHGDGANEVQGAVEDAMKGSQSVPDQVVEENLQREEMDRGGGENAPAHHDDDQEDGPDLGIQGTEDAAMADGDNGEGSSSNNRANDGGSQDREGSQMSRQSSGSSGGLNPFKALRSYRERSRDLHRQHRGLMQWETMRNAQFAKDEAKYAVRKFMQLGALAGRKPDVETEV
ncbi:Meiotically up-regulated protein [Escovopsis weberi]|uniref:Meiotically up-regulated protein n=1 Tax=Escovopsis weberi TaxID=150374 RepID=A0A0N0RTB0_ESCWE|nr:Meiotically up-regulated protein [Escovopsis weberi]